MKRMNSLLVKGFQASKCKTQLRLGTSRIKLLRNKKRIQIASDRREVAELLRNGQENNARLLVGHVKMEQDLIEAYDLLYLYAERIAAQLSVIESQKTCPLDLKEDISTLLYASSRCAELPDFAQIRPMFVAKYGKEFVSAAIELRPGCGVNGKVIERLSSNGATGETKLKLLKEIAAEHNVDWDPAPFEKEIRVDHDDVLPGPTVFTRADASSILVDDFPSVPNQKPTLGIHVSQPEDFPTPTPGRFDKVEPANSPRPGDYRTDSPGAFLRTGPPSRKPPGRDQSRAEDLRFDDRHPDMDPGSRETQSLRNQRRESDSFLAPSAQAQYQVEESRRNSIGVPREKSVRGHTGSTHADRDESLLQDYKKHNVRDAGIDDFDEASHRKGSYGGEYELGFDSRQSQKFAGKEVSGKGRPGREDQYAEVDNLRRVSREGSGKGRPQYQDQYAEEDNLRRASSREGSGKGRPQHQDQYAEEDNLRRASSREGSGKRRPQHQDQYAEEDNLRRASSREGSGDKIHFQETSVDEGSSGRTSGRGKVGKLHSGTNRKHDYSDEDADHVPHRSEEPRRRESTSYTPKYLEEDNYNPEWDDEHFRNPVTTRETRKDSEKRMSLPGGSVHDKFKYQGNRPNDDHDDSVRRRATIGPEEIRLARARETEDPPRSRYGEREKQVESRRQSAPLPKEDVMEGRHSSTLQGRHRKADIPTGYDDDRPPRFSPQVSLQEDDEYSPSTRTSRDRSDRQRKVDIPAKYDDGRPPPRFIKVGNQPNLDDEDSRASPVFKGEKPQRFVTRNDQPMPRPRSNLQSVKTDPELSGTPRTSSVPEHRKSQSAFAESSSKASAPRLQKPSPEETNSSKQAGQPPSKPTFLKPPDLDSLIQMFGKKK